MSTGPDMSCPVCKGKMLRRTNKATGQAFWGCADFPKCRGTRNTDGEPPRHFAHLDLADRDAEGDGAQTPSERALNNDRRRWDSE